MRNYQKSICILLIILLYLTKGYGQATLRFQQLNMDNGLVNGSINSFLQDYKGAIWIATDNGLTKFNGHNTTHFQPDTSKKNSIVGKIVNTIFETNDRQLIIGTNEAINIFNTQTNTFRSIKLKDYKTYRIYRQLGNSVILIEAQKKLFALNYVTLQANELQTKAYYNWKNLLNNSITPGNFSETYRKNLYQFMEQYGDAYEKDTNYLRSASINDILFDSIRAKVYFGTNTGLKIYDSKTNVFTQASSDSLRIKSLAKTNSQIVMGTAYEGLWVLDLNTNEITKNKAMRNNDACIACDYIHTLYVDRSNTIWIGCLENGVNYANLNNKIFKQVVLKNKQKKIENTSIRSLHTFNNNYWINTAQETQYITDKNFNIIKPIPVKQIDDSLSIYNYIFSFANIGVNKNYVLTAYGLFTYNNNEFKKIKIPENFSKKQWVMHHLIALDSAQLLIASRGGLLVYNAKLNTLESFKEIPITTNVNYTFLDNTKKLYVFRKNNGVEIYQKRNNKYVLLQKLLSTIDVRDHCLKANEMWLATSIGVVSFNTFDYSVNTHAKKYAFPNYDLLNITEDSKKEGFWTGTNFGLFHIQTATNKTTKYDLNDGLPSMLFASKAKIVGDSQQVFFGTDNGIFKIEKDIVLESKNMLPIQMDDLEFNEDACNFKNVLHNKNEYTIGYKYNTFTCKLLQFDYFKKHNRFQYMLKGYDKNWINAESPTSIRYANLQHGKYILLVKSIEVTNGQIVTIATFIIKAPWYKSILAYISYLIFGAWSIYKLSTMYLQKRVAKETAVAKQQQLIFIDRERISKDLHDEIGSTLSSIYLFSQVAKTQQDPVKTEKLLSTIEEQSKTLINQMDDIIWSLKSNDEFTQSLSLRLANFSLQYLTPLNINFTYSIDASLEKNITDAEIRKNIILIIREALNNVMKYSKCNEAFVSLQNTTNGITLTITDNGIGFIEANVKVGNGLSNIKKRVQSLNGNCQIIANNAKGTAIICTFPKNIIQTTT